MGRFTHIPIEDFQANLQAENERLREQRDELLYTLRQIAGKNDLEGVEDEEVESVLRNELQDCELLARAAITKAESQS